jgi:NAD(P)-dependent dehydrogenase (short-subunit alcohol dehydrogenase family)
MIDLSGRVALVTGARGGLGREYACFSLREAFSLAMDRMSAIRSSPLGRDRGSIR